MRRRPGRLRASSVRDLSPACGRPGSGGSRPSHTHEECCGHLAVGLSRSGEGGDPALHGGELPGPTRLPPPMLERTRCACPAWTGVPSRRNISGSRQLAPASLDARAQQHRAEEQFGFAPPRTASAEAVLNHRLLESASWRRPSRLRQRAEATTATRHRRRPGQSVAPARVELRGQLFASAMRRVEISAATASG